MKKSNQKESLKHKDHEFANRNIDVTDWKDGTLWASVHNVVSMEIEPDVSFNSNSKHDAFVTKRIVLIDKDGKRIVFTIFSDKEL